MKPNIVELSERRLSNNEKTTTDVCSNYFCERKWNERSQINVVILYLLLSSALSSNAELVYSSICFYTFERINLSRLGDEITGPRELL